MRVMVIVKATNDSEAGKLRSPELIAEMGRFNQSLVDAGIFVDASGLKASSRGARVTFSGKRPHGDEGPIRQRRRARRGLLDLEGEGPRRGHRLGQALPQSHARTVGHRDPRNV